MANEKKVTEEFESNIDDTLKKMAEEAEKEKAEKIQKLNIDRLRLYWGSPYQVNDRIIIKQPTIGNFVSEDGMEAGIFGAASPFISNSTTYRLQLWEMEIDWNDVSDFQFFILFCKTMNKKYSDLLFNDIDFTDFQPIVKNDTQEIVAYSPSQDIMIDEATYIKMATYMRFMFNSFPKEEFAKGKGTKRDIIFEEKMNRDRKQKEGKLEHESTLLPMISFALNHPGFKYKKHELEEVGIVEFMDSVARLQVYESTRALFSGIYSGMCDLRKVDKEEFNFMRDIINK